jgi:hypothetical protein
MVRQLFSPTVRWSDSSIVRHNRNYLTISVARKTRYMYDYNLTIVEVSQTGHWQQVYMNTLHYDKSWAWFFAVLWWPFWKWRMVDEWGLYCNHIVRPSVRSSVRSHVRNRYLSFYWKKWFYIWYMALAWWLVPCLPFPGLPHIYFLFTVRLGIFHVCRNENFRNSYLSFYWKKWFYIWYMALAWWLVPCLPFPGLPHIYFLFTVRLTNERVGVFLAWRSAQHLV